MDTSEVVDAVRAAPWTHKADHMSKRVGQFLLWISFPEEPGGDYEWTIGHGRYAPSDGEVSGASASLDGAIREQDAALPAAIDSQAKVILLGVCEDDADAGLSGTHSELSTTPATVEQFISRSTPWAEIEQLCELSTTPIGIPDSVRGGW